MRFHLEWRGALGATLALLATPVGAVQTSPEAKGAAIAIRDCGGCHAVGSDGVSAVSGAPAFRDLGKRYNVGDLAESLAEGISVGHPMMPVIAYSPQEVEELIAYLRGLQLSLPPTPGR